MSHEIVLLAGESDPYAQAARRNVVTHAAQAIPGAVTWELFENKHAAIALVSATPSGGDHASLRADSIGGAIAVLGASAAAVRAAVSTQAGPHSGAECGHVKVALGPDGPITITTDGTGIIPAFWSTSRRELRFATHLASLVSLGADASLDDTGAIEYLVMLQSLGQRTVLKEASLLPAGGRLEFVPGRSVTQTVQRLYTPSHRALSDDDAVRTFARDWSSIFEDLLERSSSERLAVGLSGGLDSRAIGYECVRQGARPPAFTYGSISTRPAQVASRIAAILQLDHTLLPLTDDRLMPDPIVTTNLLDGTHSPAEMYEFWFAPTLRGIADVVVNGHGGGPLWGDEKALGAPDPSALLDLLSGRFEPEGSAIASYLQGLDPESVHDIMRSSIHDSLQEWEVGSRPDIVSFWNVHNRQFRWGNMLSTAMRRSGLKLEAPFMDARFLRLSARLTPEQRLNGRLYLRVHREVFSDTSFVSRSDDGNPPRNLNHLFWSADRSYARQFAEFAVRHPVSAARRAAGRAQENAAHRLARVSAFSSRSERHMMRHSVFPADVWLRRRPTYRQNLIDLLSSGRPTALISQESVEQAIAALKTNTLATGALRLARVATLQVWNQDFSQRETAYRALGQR